MGAVARITTVYRLELLNVAELVWDGHNYVPASSGVVVSTHYSSQSAEAAMFARRRRAPNAPPVGIFVRGEVLHVHRRPRKEV